MMATQEERHLAAVGNLKSQLGMTEERAQAVEAELAAAAAQLASRSHAHPNTDRWTRMRARTHTQLAFPVALPAFFLVILVALCAAFGSRRARAACRRGSYWSRTSLPSLPSLACTLTLISGELRNLALL